MGLSASHNSSKDSFRPTLKDRANSISPLGYKDRVLKHPLAMSPEVFTPGIHCSAINPPNNTFGV
jgi:hypothetical protein